MIDVIKSFSIMTIIKTSHEQDQETYTLIISLHVNFTKDGIK
jgi:hypothetical protein